MPSSLCSADKPSLIGVRGCLRRTPLILYPSEPHSPRAPDSVAHFLSSGCASPLLLCTTQHLRFDPTLVRFRTRVSVSVDFGALFSFPTSARGKYEFRIESFANTRPFHRGGALFTRVLDEIDTRFFFWEKYIQNDPVYKSRI